MADNIKESTRSLGAKPLPTRIIVNTDTGAADLYVDEGVFGRTKIADGSAIGNKWTINDEFVKRWNNRNGTNLTKDQLQTVFARDLQSTVNYDRATIINKYSATNTKTYLSQTAKLPGIIDPRGGATPPGAKIPSTGPDPGAAAPAPPTATPPQYINEEPEKLKDFSQGDLIYPIDIKSDQDRITFQAVEIAKSSILDNNVASGGLKFGKERENNDVKYSAVGGSQVILPIQSTIQDDNQVKWGDDNLDALKFAQVGLFGSLANPNSALDQQLQGAFGGMVDILKNNATEAVTALAQEATNTQNLLSRTQGKILNPNLELLFNGPQLRTFSFTFKMSPRSKKEAKNVRTIIRYFKENSAVRGGAANLFLSAPYAFKIRYMSGGARHKSINRIKVCALKSINVNYTPLGTYMTYGDDYKTMVCYTMTLQFQEIIPILQGDYKELPQDFIGY